MFEQEVVLQIEKALRELGDTSAEISDSLTRLGIKGFRRVCSSCPITIYLRSKGFDVAGSSGSITHTDGICVWQRYYRSDVNHLRNMHAVRVFMLKFDLEQDFQNLQA